MKSFKYIITLLLVALFIGCNDDEFDSGFLDNVEAPSKVDALFTITQDNTGLVTIQPNGEAVTNYTVDYGDGTPDPATVAPGQKTQHNYAEGVYNVKIIANGINGKQTEITKELTVTFRAPEELEVVIAPVVGDPFFIKVTAAAEYETFFEVTYGDESAVAQFNEGDEVTHTYAAIGTYEVTVTAFSGGAATTVHTQNVTITNPLLLPIDFENPTLNYAFSDFGNAVTSVVDNPHATGINTSSKVGQSIKSPGAETWAGTAITLDEPIDFSTLHHFRLKVWSPAAGITVKFKIENLTDGAINHEVDQVTTVAGDWEYLTYDFSGANPTQDYSKVVLFFNFGAVGAGDTYFFDDIAQAAPPESLSLPLTFEFASVEYVFNGFGNAVGAKVANPHVEGINTSANVGQFIKNAGAETWAGVAMPLIAPIDFSAQHKIKAKVWSPAAGVPVLLKLENIPNTTSTELLATTTVANQWEELTWDFTGIVNANNYQNVIMFFDFNNPGVGTTFYFDDIELTN